VVSRHDERVLEPLAHGEEPFVVDLEAQGALAQSLARTTTIIAGGVIMTLLGLALAR
jgi:hypothetical protein